MVTPARGTTPWDDAVNQLWDTPPEEQAEEQPEQPKFSIDWRIWVFLLLTTVIVIGVLSSMAIRLVETRLDDLRFGTPRKSDLLAHVGHGESQSNLSTYLMSITLHRQIRIIEFPGGGPVRDVATVPLPGGLEEDLTPSVMVLLDLNGDGHKDLAVKIKGAWYFYINENEKFRPIRVDERSHAAKAMAEWEKQQ